MSGSIFLLPALYGGAKFRMIYATSAFYQAFICYNAIFIFAIKSKEHVMQPISSKSKKRFRFFPTLIMLLLIALLPLAYFKYLSPNYPIEGMGYDREMSEKMPSAWLSCHWWFQCSVISYSCDSKVPINKKHIEEGEKFVDKMGGNQPMSDCLVMHTFFDHDIMRCENSRCTVE